MSIPSGPQIPISLKPTTPTEMTATLLQGQLASIGLTCPDTETTVLDGYITEVRAQLPQGQMQSYAILGPAPATAQEAGTTNATTSTLEAVANADWTVSISGDGYATTLEYIQYQTHFDWLMKNRPSFTGTYHNPPEYSGHYNSVDAIKQMYVTVAQNSSAALVSGLDSTTIEANLANAIRSLTPANENDFNYGTSNVIFLVDNYDPTTQMADEIGVLTICWHMKIKNYKKKSKSSNTHQTTLTIQAWAVLYDSVDDMTGDYDAAYGQFGDS